jgi:hypothetical protein
MSDTYCSINLVYITVTSSSQLEAQLIHSDSMALHSRCQGASDCTRAAATGSECQCTTTVTGGLESTRWTRLPLALSVASLIRVQIHAAVRLLAVRDASAIPAYNWDCTLAPGRWLVYMLLLALPFPAPKVVRPDADCPVCFCKPKRRVKGVVRARSDWNACGAPRSPGRTVCSA